MVDPYSRLFLRSMERARPPIVVRGTKVRIDRFPMHARAHRPGTKVGQYWQMRRYICQALSAGVGVTHGRAVIASIV